MGFIYMITNLRNNKKYIGQTVYTVDFRWKHHISQSKIRNSSLYKAMREDGIQNFKIETVEEVDNSILDNREKYWIKFYNTFENGYNMTIGGAQSRKYYPEEVASFYLDNPELSATEIIKKIGCPRSSFYEMLKSQNIELRGYDTSSASFNKKKIIMMDKNTEEELKIFNSVSEACQYLGKQNTSHIKECSDGKRKTCYGYKWKIID